MPQSVPDMIGLLSKLGQFFSLNFIIMICGFFSFGLSVMTSTYSDKLSNKDVSDGFLYLGLVMFLPSLVAVVLTILAMRGLKTWKKVLLLPLMIFMETVPKLMAVLTLLFMSSTIHSLRSILNNEEMMFLLLLLEFLTFLGWICYFFFSIPWIVKMQSVSLYISNNQDMEEEMEVVSGGVHGGSLEIVVDDSPPVYEDLVAGEEVKKMEDDLSLPGYEVACEGEEQKGQHMVANL